MYYSRHLFVLELLDIYMHDTLSARWNIDQQLAHYLRTFYATTYKVWFAPTLKLCTTIHA